MYEVLAAAMGTGDATRWSQSFARLAWRLTPKAAVADFKRRALHDGLAEEERKAAMVALGYIDTQASADAMVEIAAKTAGNLNAAAVWWLMDKKDNDWKEFGIAAALKEQGIYDPDKVELIPMMIPEAPEPKLSIAEILALAGDADRGKSIATACQVCHRIEGQGVDFGPTLTGWGKTQTREVIARSVVNPSADIAHGYDGVEITTDNGLTIQGLVISEGDPVIVRSMGGQTQTIPKARIESRKRLNRSLMMSAEQFGFGAKEVADIIAYLKSI